MGERSSTATSSSYFGITRCVPVNSQHLPRVCRRSCFIAFGSGFKGWEKLAPELEVRGMVQNLEQSDGLVALGVHVLSCRRHVVQGRVGGVKARDLQV